MLLADWIALGAVLLFAILGCLLGFGKGLKFFTGGIIGIIISVFVCYTTTGIVFSWSFVSALMEKLQTAISSTGNLAPILARIIVYVILFIIIQLIRVLIVKLIAGLFEANNVVMKVINKTLGVVFFVAVLLWLALFAFHIISWIGGDTYATVYSYFEGSALKLDWILENNPLTSIFNF